jgi:hypothetical protein
MFDLARVLAVGWALYASYRARASLQLGALLLVTYVFGLELASGFTIRSEGPQEPIVAMLPALIGPTAMPRGHLPAWPLASLVVHWPTLVDLAAVPTLLYPVRSLRLRIDELPQFSLETQRLARVILALTLVAVFQAISAGTRAFPVLLDWGEGDSELFTRPPWESQP